MHLFSLQLDRESIKEEIDMTANAVTHQTLVCVCVCVCVCARGSVCTYVHGEGRRGGGTGEQNNKQDL